MNKILSKKIQIALFSPGVDLSDKLSLAHTIKSSLSSYLDGDPIILPVPDDAPMEIPRIIMRSKDDSISINIASNKIDLFLQQSEPNSELRSFSKLFTKNSKIYEEVLKVLMRSTRTVMNRSGYVVNLEIETKDPVDFIQTKYLNSKSFSKKLQEINLGVLINEKLGGKNSNIWFRINPIRDSKGELDKEKLSALFDVNTVPKESEEFDLKSVLVWLEDSSKFLDKYLANLI